MKKLFLILLTFITSFNIFTQDMDQWNMVEKKTLYSNPDGLEIDTNNRWIQIKYLNSPFGEISEDSNLERKWRLYVEYSDSEPSVSTSYHIMFTKPESKTPSFVFVRPTGFQGNLQNYTQWNTIKEESYGGYSSMYIKGATPPTISNKAKIYKIELQAWDFKPQPLETKSAAGRALPNTDIFSTAAKVKKRDLQKEAKEFAIEVMSTVINRDIEEFNSLLSDRCYSLRYGTLYFKENIPLYTNIRKVVKNSNVTLVDYKKYYTPEIKDYDYYSVLFSSWFDKEREWVPNRNYFLVFGNLNGQNSTEKAVFLIGFNGIRWEIKGIPE